MLLPLLLLLFSLTITTPHAAALATAARPSAPGPVSERQITDRLILDELEGECPITERALSKAAGHPRSSTLLPLPLLSVRAQAQSPATIDDLISGHCGDIVVIWARGTTNAGNIGSALGRCFMVYLQGNLDESVVGQGVLPYPAAYLGFLKGGSKTGVKSLVALTMRAVAQCPDAKIVLGGFSQGAQVLRRAVHRLPATIYHRILAIVSFSDSKEGRPFPEGLEERHVSFCVRGDWVCDKKYSLLNGAHKSLFYYDHLEGVVEFIRERMKDV